MMELHLEPRGATAPQPISFHQTPVEEGKLEKKQQQTKPKQGEAEEALGESLILLL